MLIHKEDTVLIHKDSIEKRIGSQQLQNYFNNGWLRGMPDAHKAKIPHSTSQNDFSEKNRIKDSDLKQIKQQKEIKALWEDLFIKKRLQLL